MRIKELLIGKRVLQPIFERLFRISLRGMNYGLGGIITSSGEVNLVKMISKKLGQESGRKNIFDVGANDGHYAEVLLKEFPSETTLHCFEPSGFSFEKLSKRFDAHENVRLVNLGLGSKSESRELYFDTKGSGWASLYARQDTGFNHHLSNSEEISIITLDDYCKDNGIDKIHFLKVDVEGFELEVFRGGQEILPNIDLIQFEFSFANYDSRTYLFEFFETLGDFKIFRVLQNGIYEIQYDPRYEILMTTNYLAVNKKFTW